MNTYVKWLKTGLRTELARRVSIENLELIIENGREFNKMRDEATAYHFNEEGMEWPRTPLNKHGMQIMPLHFKSLSFPTRQRVSTYEQCLFPAGMHCLAKLFMAHPYARKNSKSYIRYLLFGTRPENTIILAVHTGDYQDEGRTHKSYVLGQQWIYYGLTIPKPTMGYKNSNRH